MIAALPPIITATTDINGGGGTRVNPDRAPVCENSGLDRSPSDTEALTDGDERQAGFVEPRCLPRLVGFEGSNLSRPSGSLAVVDDRLAGDAVLACEVLQGEPGVPVGEELGDPLGP